MYCEDLKEVEDAIDNAITAGHDSFTASPVDFPASAKQILYVDMTGLAGSYKNAQATQSLGAYRTSTLAPNAIVFLPKGATESEPNFASKTDGNNSRAARNIILTDKQPFFTPYDIQVPSQFYAQYTRNLTHYDYEKDVNAMVILPFQLTIDSSGKHENPSLEEGDGQEGKFSFTVNTMNSADMSEGENHNYGIAYFTPVQGERTEANKPYMIKVDEASVEGENISFKAIEKGALIKATTGMSTREVADYDAADKGTYQYLYYGETVDNGSLTLSKTGQPTKNLSLTMTSEGSYSGQVYDRAASEAIFYFANNKFLNLYRLINTERYLYAYPFHPVYTFSGSDASQVRTLNGLDVTYEPIDATGIRDLAISKKASGLAVRSGKGYIEVSSSKDQTVTVLSTGGSIFNRVALGAGESKTINLPAGVYVVNNVKIIVK